ncbi:MAG: DUF4097 family beta strand repeat-containing protein [Anaeroplasmataceae bacterium]|nr:DUF4097 family beta strand repeat-containing protein [Anaeroplasmataceae bacterium]
MKEEYLTKLKEALEQENVKNVDTIVDLYRSRFDLGSEAGMTDEEIISSFKPIEEIANDYIKTDLNENEDKSNYVANLDFTIFSDFRIEKKETKGVDFEIDDEALKYLELKIQNKHIQLKHKNVPFLTKRAKYEGTMYIGPDVSFDSFTIQNVNCDVKVCFIKCEQFDVANVNGDIDFEGIECSTKMGINNTTGDIKIHNLISVDFKAKTISGDLFIKELCCDTVRLATVSGDIHIENSNSALYSISCVSGDVTIKSDIDLNQVSASSVSGTVTVCGVAIGENLGSKIKKVVSKTFHNF